MMNFWQAVGIVLILFAFPISFGLLSQFSPLISQVSQSPNSSILSKKISPPVFKPQALSLTQIFSDNHQWTATLSGEHLHTLIATGDVIPARSVNYQTLQANDFTWPFTHTAEILKQADLTFINLESPLVPNCPVTNEGMIFCGDPRHIEGLQFAGVDIVNLANNHLGNWGQEGIISTQQLLNQANILTTGCLGPTYTNINGLRLAFLGYNDIPEFVPGLSQVDKNKIKTEVSRAKQQADIVIVAFHWGVEYTNQPTSRQQELAHWAIDAGADLIIGNHPHWIQPVEIYQNKLIMYAHGNFIFDQMWSLETREGVIGRYVFYDKQLIDAQFLPIQINDFGQPHLLEDQAKQAILDKLQTISLNLSISLNQ